MLYVELVDHEHPAGSHQLTQVPAGLLEGFGFRFDFGDEWIHECMVEESRVDPVEVYGEPPLEPVPIFGWGTIPDQYGRTTDDRDVEPLIEPEIPFPFLHDELARIIELNGGEPMTSAEPADTINVEGRYHKKDGSPVTSSQISARMSKYPRLFERVDDGCIRHRPERG